MIAADDDMQVVVFGLGAESFALPVAMVREILDHRPAFRVPNAPGWLLGLTDVRGTSVPMVDLRLRLGLPPVEPTLATRILVVEVAGGGRPAPLTLGLVVDRVMDVATFASDALESSPEIGTRWSSEHIRGILRRGADFIVLLDLDQVFGGDVAVGSLAGVGLAA